ncbi:MAG: metallophosphoesterase family protein [Candidatus Bathycorpusculaceae bacterium]
MTRLLFASDFHGSIGCWRKSLTVITRNNVDVAILSGDLTAKAIVPIVEQKDGNYKFAFFKKTYSVKKKNLEKEIERIKSFGLYAYLCTEEKARELAQNKSELLKLFDELATESIKEWLNMADKVLGDKIKDGKIKLIVMPGNDDTYKIDDVIQKSGIAIYPLNKVVKIDDFHEMISFDKVNPSPWATPREATEEEIEKILDELFSKVQDKEHLIFVSHCPPYDSGLDLAPKLDEKMTPIYTFGQPVMIPVGSKSVLKMVKKHQPKLALFGHIHEASGFVKIGRTLCLNPGSEYDRNVFRCYLIDISKDKIDKYWRMEG